MTAREGGEVKGIQGIAVQENGSTVVSSADTVNIVGGGTVTDVGGVATINIPEGVQWYREDVPAGSATYTFVNEPATATSFLIFTDSGTLLFSGIDYTYNASTQTVTFLSLDTNEAAYIWVAHATVLGGGIGDMVKSVYDPTNINASAFDYNNFINTPVVNTRMFILSSNSDLATAQEIYDWYAAGKYPVIYYDNNSYVFKDAQQGALSFICSVPELGEDVYQDNSIIKYKAIELFYTGSTVTNISFYSWLPGINYLDTDVDYTIPYVPQYDGSPATKKYVDDGIADKVEGPASSVDGNIAVFDGATGKLIKDSGFNIQYTETHPTGDNVEVYYDNGTIYLYKPPVSVILTESGNTLTTENNDPLILEN